MNKFKKVLEDVLKKEESFLNSETGEINYVAVKESADTFEPKLISLLADNTELREKFFTQIKDVHVFSVRDFKFFLDENKVNNSYTQYANRIGLSSDDEFLSDQEKTVLNFPFKDCVLEGGQSCEELRDLYHEFKDEEYVECIGKREEIFFNQVLAKDEIDRLLDKKALTNWTRFDKNSGKYGSKTDSIQRDAEFNKRRGLPENTITDNLLIEGNNLIALHTIKDLFKSKVKMIYIDPPYNTGGSTDIFTYNNTFKHSTWLTFMKNRLEIAKELLRDDGFIAITIDHEELFYLGALADEIYGRNNRIGLVTVYINPKGRQHERFFSASTEYMLVYAKDATIAKFRDVTIDDDASASFNLEDKDGKYRLEQFIRARTSTLRENKPNFWYPVYVSKDLKEISSVKKAGYHEVFPVQNGKEYTWKTKKDTFEKRNVDGFFSASKEGGEIIISHKYREQQVFKNIWTDKKYFPEFQGTNLLKKILGENRFSYPKSLYAVLDTLKIMTDDGDIVLDFHAGSGTTAHAVIELNKDEKKKRQFIMIEQLSEHTDVCIDRLQTVIANDKSKESFLYVSLAKWNESALKKIEDAENLKSLEKLLDSLYEKYFLNYNVRIKDFKEKIIKEDNFKKLSLKEQKKMFRNTLDLNQMYVQESEMSDKRYSVGKEDQKLTNEFYGK